MPSATAAVIAGVFALVGAGVSAYGQYQNGKSQQAIANFNAQQKEKQAQTQMLAMRTQAALQRQQAEANFKLRQADAQARFANAKSLENKAKAQEAVDRMNLRDRHEEYERLRSQQLLAVAASGVQLSGTPMELFLATVTKINLDLARQHWANNNTMDKLYAESRQEELGGKMALAGATMDRDSEIAQAALKDRAGYNERIAGMSDATSMRASGDAARVASRYQATATLFEGASSAFSSFSTIGKYKAPSTSSTSTGTSAKTS